MEGMRSGSAKAHDNHLGDRVDDPLIDRLHWVIRQAIRVLAVLMVAVILWTVADVVLVLYEKLSDPPFLLLDLKDIFVVFAAFLAVLIAIEIFVNITLYLRDDVIHVKLVIATALAHWFMQAEPCTSGLPLTSHMPCSRVMPLRLGMRFCTSAMFLSDNTKSSGTTLARLSRNAVTP